MTSRVERKRFLMMKLLRESGSPLSSQRIQEQLAARGMEISERTVRLHLQALDQEGFTVYKEKKGRYLTPKGIAELAKARVFDRVGFLSSKIDDMTYRMTFNPRSSKGLVVVNLSLVDSSYRDSLPELMAPVFSSGLAHGTLMALFTPGEKIGEILIPENMIGIGTVCSITFNGALIHAGIPVSSVFGGLLEMHEWSPDRFTAVIRYDGTSLDPLEIYISSGMTSTGAASQSGSGLIGASFREIPDSAIDLAMDTDALLKKRGLGGYLKSGYPGQSFLDFPVGEQRIGLVISGGLNAVAPLFEAGIPIQSRALSGLVDYSRLFSFEELSYQLGRID